MEAQKSQRVFAGLSLIGLGLLLFFLNRWEGIGDSAILFVVGGLFLAAYFYRRVFGLLIPACILLGLGWGSAFGGEESTLLGLGCGFVAIYVIALLYERRNNWWPLIPGTALILLALDKTEIIEYVFTNWPLILVFIGVLILLGAIGRPRSQPR